MAYLASYNLVYLDCEESEPDIDPEMSNIITAFNILSSLGSPSFPPLRKIARNSFIFLSLTLEGLLDLAKPMCRSKCF